MSTEVTRCGLSTSTDHLEHFPIDMDEVARQATQGPKVYDWTLTFDVTGQEYIWTGRAASRAMAELQALAELAEQCDVNRYRARLVSALQKPTEARP